ncbi:MAG: site-2 protease family protein [Candidatus Pacearchaeota archaeon]
MNKIIIIDLVLFLLFCVFVSLFLYKKRKNLKREGLIFLYKTKIGIEFMNRFSNKHKKLLQKMSFFIIGISILLMIAVILLVLTQAYLYVTNPKEVIEKTEGAPPIAPVIPYFPQLFGMKSFFPNFYFVYFIIAFSIVALFHEMAHGLYMVLYKVKIKSTGFLFLGPILGAFVEQDDKEFRKKKNNEQMATLGAGVFANTLLAIFFAVILMIFFFSFYKPSGYLIIPSAVDISPNNITEIRELENNLTLIKSEDGRKYLANTDFLNAIKENLSDHEKIIVLLYSPVVINNLSGYITEIDGKKIRGSSDIKEALKEKKPGEEVIIKTEINNQEKTNKVKLEEHPLNSSMGFIGLRIVTEEEIRILVANEKNPIKRIIMKIGSIKNPFVLYKSSINNDLAEYIYYLMWWCMMINFFVALFNMLPFGIFDGGRFSYLLILSIVKSKEKTEKIHKILSSTMILSFLLIILSWLFGRLVF